MLIAARPIKVWPDGWKEPGRARQWSPFRASYRDTLDLLDRELRALDTTDVTLQVDARPGDIRLDGQLRADAKVTHPGVILTAHTGKHGTLVYPCDAFDGRLSQPGWQANLRAIALGLEALRRVARYGIADRGQQYAGYRELGAGPAAPGQMTVEDAARFLITHGEPGGEPADVETIVAAAGDTTGPGREVIAEYYRHAAKQLHPDTGGDPTLFARLNEARDLLLRRSR